MAEAQNPQKELEKIIEEVKSIIGSLPKGELPEEIETGDIYSLADLYAEHAAMFEMLSERLLDVKLGILVDGKSKIREILGDKIHEIKKGHIEKLKEIKGKLDSNNEYNKKIIELIDEVIELKKIKKHIAVDRLRASGGQQQQQQQQDLKQFRENLRTATEKREEYANSNSLETFKGIPNSIQITDIHNDMYHFLLGMTEPIGDPAKPAFKIGDPTTKIEKIGDKEYTYPNLVYNSEFNGTITFGGDLIQSHDSGVNDNLGAIPLCLAMRECIIT